MELDTTAQPDTSNPTAVIDSPCPAGGSHQWRLTEDGYTRWWHTTITGTTIHALFGGTSDFSETGTGEHLECLRCGTTTPVPDGFDLDYC